jgi:hypothetical protein
MTSKKDRTANSGNNVIASTSKVSRTPMIGVKNISALCVIPKKAKTTSHFVSHFSPEIIYLKD